MQTLILTNIILQIMNSQETKEKEQNGEEMMFI